MGFGSKFKMNLEHFPEVFEKYTRFPKFTLFFSISKKLFNILGISYVRINGKTIWS